MSKARTAKFVVEFQLPDDATVADAQGYVHDAIRVWCGSLMPSGTDDGPGDPMFYLDRDTVVVKRYRKPRK